MNIFDPSQPFWRAEPLSETEFDLLQALLAAHHKLAMRRNLSTETAIGAAQGSGDFGKAFAAAFLTIGGKHAPLAETMAYLQAPVDAYQIVPGWGNSLVSGEDTVWTRVRHALWQAEPDMVRLIDATTASLHEKHVFPNAACYTAAVALVLGIPPKTAPLLFLWGRMMAWAELIHKNL